MSVKSLDQGGKRVKSRCKEDKAMVQGKGGVNRRLCGKDVVKEGVSCKIGIRGVMMKKKSYKSVIRSMKRLQPRIRVKVKKAQEGKKSKIRTPRKVINGEKKKVYHQEARRMNAKP